MSARTELAAHLSGTLGNEWDVIDKNTDPTLSKTTVMVWTDRIVPAGGVSDTTRRRYTVIALVMTPKQVGGDDDLDDAVEEVLEAIDLWDYPMVWTAVEAVIYADKYPAFRITNEVSMKHVIPEED